MLDSLFCMMELFLQVFQRIADDFRLIMGDAVKDPRVIAILRCSILQNKLQPSCRDELTSNFVNHNPQGREHKEHADIYA